MSDVWTPPRAEVKDLGVSGNPDAPDIRRQHLGHEASVKAVGSLYLFGAIIGFLAGVAFLFVPFNDLHGSSIASVGVAAFMLVLSVLYFWIGRGLRGLKPVARIPSGILAGIGLIGFPMGTLINGYILYLLFSKKGTMVFSDEYKQIIADTPDMKYRTPIIVWIIVVLLLGAVALGIFGASR